MQARIRHLAAVLVGAAVTLATASGIACSIAPTNPNRIKQMMANEIAHRLGMRPHQISLDSITTPQLVTPFGLGADCRGLAAYHHTAGFRVGDGERPRPWPGPGPSPWPGPGPTPDPDPDPGWPRPAPRPNPDPGPEPFPDHLPVPGGGPGPGPGRGAGPGPSLPRPGFGPGRWPGQDHRPSCVYEGVAVVLGYGYSSPVAVNFERRCR